MQHAFERRFFERPVVKVAKGLLGAVIATTVRGKLTSGIIVEVEAYHESEPASHSFRGRTKRTEVMFGPGGFCYVYFIYGMHYCVNVVAEQVDTGAAVLVRAIEPLAGLETMERRRGIAGYAVTNGPAKLCEALAIDKRFLGEDLLGSDRISLRPYLKIPKGKISASPRVGISKAKELHWRFSIEGNPWVSS